MLHIVLTHPEIPHNTGAAGRLCLATNTRLHLIKPLGFSLDDRQVKRVGLDYWKDVDLQVWESWDDFESFISNEQKKENPPKVHFLTTKTDKPHWSTSFSDGDYLIFGSETKGIPESLLAKYSDSLLTIPMVPNSTRSLNLSTSVGIVLYEAVRQITAP